jgi:hypothetical protein
MVMKKIGVALIVVFSIITVQARADIVETTGGHIYRGTITKMDENEVVLKTATGITRIPRSQVKAFQSEPPPGTSATSGTSLSSQPSDTQKKTASILGESAREALRALKKLEARCQAGISYQDYGPALGEAKFEVNLFLESSEAKKRVKLAESIDKVMGHYDTAGTVWKRKFSESSDSSRGLGGIILLKYDFGQSLLKLYPNANKDYKEGGALLTVQISKRSPTITHISIDSLLPIIWREASNELTRAMSLLSE